MSATEPDFQEPGKARPQVDRERIVANREMGRALRAIQSVRTFYVVLAVGAGIFTLIAFAAGTRVATGFAIVLSVLPAVLCVVAAVGAWRIGKEPVVWAVIVACLWSLFVLLTLFDPPHLNLMKIIFMVLAGGCWAAVLVIRPAMALMVKYPDLRIARKLRGEKRATSRAGSSSRGGRRRGRR